MTSKEKPSINLYEPRTVSCEGFRIDNAAGVAIENCLNEGVHPNTLVGEIVGSVVEFGGSPYSRPWEAAVTLASLEPA